MKDDKIAIELKPADVVELTSALTDVSQTLAITYEATAMECMLAHTIIAATGLLFMTGCDKDEVKDLLGRVVDHIGDKDFKANADKSRKEIIARREGTR